MPGQSANDLASESPRSLLHMLCGVSRVHDFLGGDKAHFPMAQSLPQLPSLLASGEAAFTQISSHCGGRTQRQSREGHYPVMGEDPR